MIKFKVGIANTQVDKQRDLITKEALEQVAKEAKNTPVYYKFDYTKPIGRIIEFEIKEDTLIATIELDETKEKDIENHCFRIGGIMLKKHKIKDITIIDELELMSIGMIPKENDVYKKG